MLFVLGEEGSTDMGVKVPTAASWVFEPGPMALFISGDDRASLNAAIEARHVDLTKIDMPSFQAFKLALARALGRADDLFG